MVVKESLTLSEELDEKIKSDDISHRTIEAVIGKILNQSVEVQFSLSGEGRVIRRGVIVLENREESFHISRAGDCGEEREIIVEISE